MYMHICMYVCIHVMMSYLKAYLPTERAPVTGKVPTDLPDVTYHQTRDSLKRVFVCMYVRMYVCTFN